MQFKELPLDPRLLRTLDHLGFDQATEIQQRAIPVLLAGRDLLASSKTGSGKTLAFLLPAMQRVLKTRALSKRDPRVLILTPTRELAKQVFKQLKTLIANTPIKATLLLGGEDYVEQAKALRRDPQFVVATPGRLGEHLNKRNLFLAGLELLILDEADRMLDLGFAEELKQINQAANHRLRQTQLFSATLDHDQVETFAADLLKSPEQVSVGFINEQHQDIAQQFYLCDHLDHKQALLQRLLEQADLNQAIIFTATRSDTDRLATWLQEAGHNSAALSGELSQAERNRIMEAFRDGRHQLLITTDVASRGLDLLNVSHVINFDLPKHAEEYVHRIGRTGRAGAKGSACSLVGPKDWDSFKKIQAFLGQAISFDTLEGLEGKFKGLREKPTRPGSAKRKTKPQRQRQAAKKTQPTSRRQGKVFQQGADSGDMPVLKRKKAD